MCDVYRKARIRSYTGYKVVITNQEGRHFSPFTGIEYLVGDVPEFKEYLPNSLRKVDWSNEQNNHRLTAVFTSYKVARDNGPDIIRLGDLRPGWTRNILKITLTGDIYEGGLWGFQLLLGNHISKIHVMKTYKDN
jgi:hypothetical protein